FNKRPHFPVTLVSSISRYSGQGSSVTTSLHYQDAWYYFASEVERELAGYGRVIVTDPLNQKTIYYFHQGGGFDGSALGESADNWALIGQMYRREAFNAQGKMVQRTIHHWETTALGSKRHFI